ncbi:MFS transporter [Alicyclobacillus sp.]|uniref:MFS transporter n=1 Tax=Alicyclobacillus sp. TaxID=61169 RepID=UPI0025C68E32|nr:MFS transporter [Alicyclobacillus sp.]MCL6516077.1 MFS transporter [Alicyclobacillus sp.]
MANVTAVHDVAASATRKVRNHIIPWIIILYIVAFLDRTNTGYAALTMNKALGISAEAFGLVSGIFFIGYFIFEVPSNMILHRVGARVWIARILVSWGIVAMLTAAVENVTHLYILRFLLGVAEAGFFPGMILYITFWFRTQDQAKAVGLFMTALALSNIIGAPVSGLILDHIHWLGWGSWRWLYILEGLPAVVCGILTLYLLPDRPNNANWLTQEEKDWLNGELEKEREAKLKREKLTIGQVFTNGRVWLFAGVYFCLTTGFYGINFWMPQIVKAMSSHFSNTTVGLLAMIPYIAGAIGMVWNGRHSDRTLERRWHTALPPFVGAVTLVLMGMATGNVTWSIILLTIGVFGIYCFYGPFWALPNLFLTEATAAVGIAIVNSVGNLGGFVGPYILGYVKQATGSTQTGLYVMAVFLVVCTLLVLSLRKEHAVSTHVSGAPGVR